MKKTQWGLAWDSIWKKSNENANQWKWFNVTNARQSFFDEVVNAFEIDFETTMNGEDSRVVNLKARVATHDSTVGLVDILKIEHEERQTLAAAHLVKAQKSAVVIAEKIYGKLEQLHDTLLESIGVDYSVESDFFDLDAIVPRSTCHAQIEALVMRVAFPVGVAYLRWGKLTKNRQHSIDELKQVCPETQEDRD
jgi:hypothetical protein